MATVVEADDDPNPGYIDAGSWKKPLAQPHVCLPRRTRGETRGSLFERAMGRMCVSKVSKLLEVFETPRAAYDEVATFGAKSIASIRLSILIRRPIGIDILRL